MRIKRLEINGFKSFTDKTVFQFGHGMTAVVGPNGCGKSNIVDAILWCMGEQSPKHLRGKDMSDVIFAGSEARPPSGMAEVSLFFDVADSRVSLGFAQEVDELEEELEHAAEIAKQAALGAAGVLAEATKVEEELTAPPIDPNAPPVDAAAAAPTTSKKPWDKKKDEKPKLTDAPLTTLQGFTEIQVTRRLFRSGESEYLMNRTPCRLRDIQEMFMDAGLGKGAYSIIEQGKVGLIVSSKPEDRRLFIEEAAGIAKFKSRKKQALQKMEQTELNLLRVNDVVTELAKQMNSLDRQAKKAERYRKLRDEIRDIDLKVAAADYKKRSDDLGAEQAAIAEIEEKEMTASAEITAQEGDVESTRTRLQDDEFMGVRGLAHLSEVSEAHANRLENKITG